MPHTVTSEGRYIYGLGGWTPDLDTAGALDAGYQAMASTWVYDPAQTDFDWQLGPDLAQARGAPACTYSPLTGRFFVFGGEPPCLHCVHVHKGSVCARHVRGGGHFPHEIDAGRFSWMVESFVRKGIAALILSTIPAPCISKQLNTLPLYSTERARHLLAPSGIDRRRLEVHFSLLMILHDHGRR